MSTDSNEITYIFHLAHGQTERIRLHFDPHSFLLRAEPPDPPAGWTRLGFHVCPHCPLTPAEGRDCPFALAMSGFIARFDDVYSYEPTKVEVVTDQRTVVAERPLQDAMASIMGLIGATSGCPHLDFFRPMARFHLPFASEQETLVRAFSIHLLGEYLRAGGEGEIAIGVQGLNTRYRAVATVNQSMAERLRAAFERDAGVNAIVILDTFARAVPFVVEEALRELRPVFDLPP